MSAFRFNLDQFKFLSYGNGLITKVIWLSVSCVFPGLLTPKLTQLFFPKPPTTFLTCFCRGERRKYAGEKDCLNLGSNSQPPGHESDALTTEPPGWDNGEYGRSSVEHKKRYFCNRIENTAGKGNKRTKMALIRSPEFLRLP